MLLVFMLILRGIVISRCADGDKHAAVGDTALCQDTTEKVKSIFAQMGNGNFAARREGNNAECYARYTIFPQFNVPDTSSIGVQCKPDGSFESYKIKLGTDGSVTAKIDFDGCCSVKGNNPKKIPMTVKLTGLSSCYTRGESESCGSITYEKEPLSAFDNKMDLKPACKFEEKNIMRHVVNVANSQLWRSFMQLSNPCRDSVVSDVKKVFEALIQPTPVYFTGKDYGEKIGYNVSMTYKIEKFPITEEMWPVSLICNESGNLLNIKVDSNSNSEKMSLSFSGTAYNTCKSAFQKGKLVDVKGRLNNIHLNIYTDQSSNSMKVQFLSAMPGKDFQMEPKCSKRQEKIRVAIAQNLGTRLGIGMTQILTACLQDTITQVNSAFDRVLQESFGNPTTSVNVTIGNQLSAATDLKLTCSDDSKLRRVEATKNIDLKIVSSDGTPVADFSTPIWVEVGKYASSIDVLKPAETPSELASSPNKDVILAAVKGFRQRVADAAVEARFKTWQPCREETVRNVVKSFVDAFAATPSLATSTPPTADNLIVGCSGTDTDLPGPPSFVAVRPLHPLSLAYDGNKEMQCRETRKSRIFGPRLVLLNAKMQIGFEVTPKKDSSVTTITLSKSFTSQLPEPEDRARCPIVSPKLPNAINMPEEMILKDVIDLVNRAANDIAAAGKP